MKKIMIIGLLVCGMASQNVQSYVKDPTFDEVMHALSNGYDHNSLQSILNQIKKVYSIISMYSSSYNREISFNDMHRLQIVLVNLQNEYNDLLSTIRVNKTQNMNNSTVLPTEIAQVEQNQDDQNDQEQNDDAQDDAQTEMLSNQEPVQEMQGQDDQMVEVQELPQEEQDQEDENVVATDNESDAE